MEETRLDHHLNSIKMCKSDLAISRCIERIFEEGNRNGWNEAGKCPNCLEDLPDVVTYCDNCKKNANKIIRGKE